ncbi:MAG: glycoside hydrolase family 15 protein [Myxococcota bacterium]
MHEPIENYALIGDCKSLALVSNTGSMDWLCLPRFDSGACFAALLGTHEHGRWLIRPVGHVRATRRRYRGDTLILETVFETHEGVATVVDCMPLGTDVPEVVRLVVGTRGVVRMRTELIIRFDYGAFIPWVRAKPDGIVAIAGPDLLRVRTPVRLHGENFHTLAEFTVSEGQTVPFSLTWAPSTSPEPPCTDPQANLARTEAAWREWSRRCTYQGHYRDLVMRSLITLKALTYAPTGGIIAAATTSLPEELGGSRNWDYRYCWLRDATFALYALLTNGYLDEARAWRQWLLRAVAGYPPDVQIMYGVAGERRLVEQELDWLPGYANSRPVRVGNAAHRQLQLDIHGEIMDTLHVGRCLGLEALEDGWRVQVALMRALEKTWRQPDEGIWEVRAPRRHFTHSRMMAWVAADRAVKSVERYTLPGPVDEWRALRQAIHDDICQHGFNPTLNSFVQHYGSEELDASLLMLPLVGFLPAKDPRVVGTVQAIQRGLTRGGLVQRYRTPSQVDGVAGGEGAFLACSFWLADNLALQGRTEEARVLFERLVALSNDVGLLSEQYDVDNARLVGNFPQAFSHVGLINTARNLAGPGGAAERRQRE